MSPGPPFLFQCSEFSAMFLNIHAMHPAARHYRSQQRVLVKNQRRDEAEAAAKAKRERKNAKRAAPASQGGPDGE